MTPSHLLPSQEVTDPWIAARTRLRKRSANERFWTDTIITGLRGGSKEEPSHLTLTMVLAHDPSNLFGSLDMAPISGRAAFTHPRQLL